MGAGDEAVAPARHDGGACRPAPLREFHDTGHRPWRPKADPVSGDDLEYTPMFLLAAPRRRSPVDEPNAEECMPLVVLLHSLLSSLGRHGHGEPPPGVDGSPFDRWDDDSYTYFECAVAELADRDIDISLHDGKALIRVGR